MSWNSQSMGIRVCQVQEESTWHCSYHCQCLFWSETAMFLPVGVILGVDWCTVMQSADQYDFNGMWMREDCGGRTVLWTNTGASQLCSWSNVHSKYFPHMGVHYMTIFILGIVWFVHRLAAEALNTRQHVDWTKHQSGASRIAGCRCSQKHGLKFIWIVSVDF
jgi:hypothetical protein